VFYTIYKTTNNINDKIYIGKHKTKDLNDNYMGSGKNLRRSIEKYGIENFDKEILFIFDNEDDMNAKEAELVSELFVKEDTNYNICPGGQGGWGHINSSIWTKEKRLEHNKKYSPFKNFSSEFKSNLGKNLSNRRKELIESGEITPHSPWNKGKSYELEKLKGHTNQTGSKNSQYGIKRAWVNKQGIRKKILETELENFLTDGWNKGYKV